MLPAALRRSLALDEGTVLAIRQDGQRLVLERKDEVLRRVRSNFASAGGGPRLSDELIADRRAEVARESKE